MKQNQEFDAYVCTVCGYLYDQESAEQNVQGSAIPLESLDEGWTCPVCGVGTALFERLEVEVGPKVENTKT